jgi:hypothetical protein
MMTLLRKVYTSQIAACASQTIDRTGSFMRSCIRDIYFVSVKYLQRIIRRNIPLHLSSRFPKYYSERNFNAYLQCVLQSFQIQFNTGMKLMDTEILLPDLFNQNGQQNIFSTISKVQFKFSGSFPVLLIPYPVNRIYNDDFVRGIFHASPLFTRY